MCLICILFLFRFWFFKLFESGRWQMEGTVDRSINKHFCSQMNPASEKQMFLVSGD